MYLLSGTHAVFKMGLGFTFVCLFGDSLFCWVFSLFGWLVGFVCLLTGECFFKQDFYILFSLLIPLSSLVKRKIYTGGFEIKLP